MAAARASGENGISPTSATRTGRNLFFISARCEILMCFEPVECGCVRSGEEEFQFAIAIDGGLREEHGESEEVGQRGGFLNAKGKLELAGGGLAQERRAHAEGL